MGINLRTEATIGDEQSFRGIGVHGGRVTSIRVLPAPENLGVVFKRTDVLDKNPYIALSSASVVSSNFCTKIANNDGVMVSVVEHLLAAFSITGITNALVEVDSDEIPIMDGSAEEFVEAITKVGIVKQRSFVPAVIIKRKIIVEFSGGRITIVPFDGSHVTVRLDYDKINPVIGQYNRYSFNTDKSLRQLASARTFGWIEDWERLTKQGLGLGASEENTIGITHDHKILNKEGLRTPQELVMHKSLDFLGDIFVLGCDIIGCIECLNPSHALNNLLLQTVMSEIADHELVTEQNNSEIFRDIKYCSHECVNPQFG
jgi:UDP-3-O-[3-hydroxymyristoyl] N-acetylglucosamine deacetylase